MWPMPPVSAYELSTNPRKYGILSGPSGGGRSPSRGSRGTGGASRGAIRIEGLADFQRDMRSADVTLRREFNKILRTAGDPIIEEAQRLYYQGNPASAWPHGWGRRTGRSLRGIKTKTHFGGVALELGGGRYRYLLGQEWGSYAYPQFGPPRGASGDGRGTFFWPAYKAGLADVQRNVLSAMSRATATLAGRSRGAARLAGHLDVLP